MLKNKRGLSLIGVLLVLFIILVLTHITMKKMIKTDGKKGPNQKSQLGQTVQNVRATVKNMEQAAAQRANADQQYR